MFCWMTVVSQKRCHEHVMVSTPSRHGIKNKAKQFLQSSGKVTSPSMYSHIETSTHHAALFFLPTSSIATMKKLQKNWNLLAFCQPDHLEKVDAFCLTFLPHCILIKLGSVSCHVLNVSTYRSHFDAKTVTSIVTIRDAVPQQNPAQNVVILATIATTAPIKPCCVNCRGAHDCESKECAIFKLKKAPFLSNWNNTLHNWNKEFGLRNFTMNRSSSYLRQH